MRQPIHPALILTAIALTCVAWGQPMPCGEKPASGPVAAVAAPARIQTTELHRAGLNALEPAVARLVAGNASDLDIDATPPAPEAAKAAPAAPPAVVGYGSAGSYGYVYSAPSYALAYGYGSAGGYSYGYAYSSHGAGYGSQGTAYGWAGPVRRAFAGFRARRAARLGYGCYGGGPAGWYGPTEVAPVSFAPAAAWQPVSSPVASGQVVCRGGVCRLIP